MLSLLIIKSIKLINSGIKDNIRINDLLIIDKHINRISAINDIRSVKK